jgi:hypothetical protein
MHARVNARVHLEFRLHLIIEPESATAISAMLKQRLCYSTGAFFLENLRQRGN